MANKTATSVIKDIKAIGWGHVSVSKVTGFKGAVQNFQSDNGSNVAVIFGSHTAYVLEDEQGLYTQDDAIGLIKDNGFDVTDPNRIENTTILALVGDGAVQLHEDKLTKYGLNAHEVIESITNRLKALDYMNHETDVPM